MGRTDLFAVVPAVVVHPLPQQLDGWLGSILLQHGHVQIVDKKYEVPTHWRPKHSLPPARTELSGHMTIPVEKVLLT